MTRIRDDSTVPICRAIVVGTTGCGKTTLAARLAAQLGAPHVELDALHWDPGWQMAELELFRRRVSKALEGERWVADGNYSKVRDIVWVRADTLVWLDYWLPRILWQLLGRTWRRVVSGEELWNGNRETWRNAFFARDNLCLYAIRTHRRRRRQYTVALTKPHHAHLRIIRLRSPRETEKWLVNVPSEPVTEI